MAHPLYLVLALAAQAPLPNRGVRQDTLDPSPTCFQCVPSYSDTIKLTSETTVPTIGRLGGVALLGRQVWITDIGFKRLLILDPDGHGSVVGREGQGPGEFRFPIFAASCGASSVVIFDAGNRRLTRYSATRALLGAFDVDVPAWNTKGLACDSTGQIFLSASAQGIAERRSVVHRFGRDGRYIGSAIPASVDYPSDDERLQSDGGPLAVYPPSNHIWFARAGPRFEVYELSSSGKIERHLTFPTSFNPVWTPRLALIPGQGGTQVSSKPLLGAIGLFFVAPDTLMCLSLVDDTWNYRFDLLSAITGRLISSWRRRILPDQLRPVGGDGQGHVFLRSVDGDLSLYRVRFRLDTPQTLHQ
jgi:hypothetical protein